MVCFKTFKPEEQLPCHLTYTTPGVEKVVKESLHLNCHIHQDTKGPRWHMQSHTHTHTQIILNIINQKISCLLQILPFHWVKSTPFSRPTAPGVAGTWGADIWAFVPSGSVNDHASWNAAQPYQRDPSSAESRDSHTRYGISVSFGHSNLIHLKVLLKVSCFGSPRVWCAIWLCVSHSVESCPAGQKHPGSFSCRPDQWNNRIWRGCCSGSCVLFSHIEESKWRKRSFYSVQLCVNYFYLFKGSQVLLSQNI